MINLNLKSGYILDTLVLGGLIHHYGIVIIEKLDIYVVHNTWNDNVILDTLHDFLIDRKLVGVIENKVNFDKIIEIKDMKYNLFNFNCVHFINIVSC